MGSSIANNLRMSQIKFAQKSEFVSARSSSDVDPEQQREDEDAKVRLRII